MRIYLDNCCYNRPYDDQTQLRIKQEAEAKMHIQHMVEDGKVELATSYVLDWENAGNKIEGKRNHIQDFMDENESAFVTEEHDAEVREKAKEIQKTGVKAYDAMHVVCAEIAGCEYFITTDDRLLKYKTDALELVTPGEFIRRWEESNDEEQYDGGDGDNHHDEEEKTDE